MSLNTSKTPTVSEALETRITVRDFLDTPVPDDILRAILEKAMRSPSGGNLQPWKLHVMTGDTLAAFKKTAAERTLSGKLEEPTYRAYPSPLWEPQRICMPRSVFHVKTKWDASFGSRKTQNSSKPLLELSLQGIRASKCRNIWMLAFYCSLSCCWRVKTVCIRPRKAGGDDLYADRASLEEVSQFYD